MEQDEDLVAKAEKEFFDIIEKEKAKLGKKADMEEEKTDERKVRLNKQAVYTIVLLHEVIEVKKKPPFPL